MIFFEQYRDSSWVSYSASGEIKILSDKFVLLLLWLLQRNTHFIEKQDFEKTELIPDYMCLTLL